LHRLLLVRHGETAYNTDGRFRGRADPPLTARGRMQARALGSALAQWVDGSLIASPRVRATATVDLIAQRLGRPATTDERFDDLDYGQWTGLEPSQVSAQWPTEYELWREAPDRLRLPGGERVSTARDRVWEGCRDLVRASPVVIVVTHDVCIRMATCALLDAPLASLHRFRIDLASITEMVFQDSAFQLARVNDTAHLRHVDGEPSPTKASP
jgi:broad specificity phosphatase PhoE